MLNLISKYWVYIFVAIIILNIAGGLFFYKQIQSNSGCSKIIFDINEKNLKKCESDKKSLKEKTDSLQKQIDNKDKGIQAFQISQNSDLSLVSINTSNWHTYASVDYGISFNYPNDWYYLINTLQNGKIITFFDKNNVEQMTLDDVRRYQYPPCIPKDKKVYFINTKSTSTDVLIALENESLTKTDISAEIKWTNNLTKQDWIENTCRDFKKIYMNIKPEEKNYNLSVFYEIAKSFKTFNNDLSENTDPTEINKQNNDYIKEIVMENIEKYFDYLGQMKIGDISGASGIIQTEGFMDTKVNYEGNVILTGRYDNYINQQGAYFQNEICFYTEDKESLAKIPRLKKVDYPKDSMSFCFSNKELAEKEFAPEGSSGTVTIEIDSLIIHYADMGVMHYGNLVRIIKKE